MLEPTESKSGEEATPQRLVSVDGDPKNHPYINNSVSIRNRFNKELLAGLVKLDSALKIQISGEPIHLLQIKS